MSTKSTPTNRAEKEEVDFGENVISQLLGSTIVAFGANEDGEILLSARKGDQTQTLHFVIALDEDGEVSLFGVDTNE